MKSTDFVTSRFGTTVEADLPSNIDPGTTFLLTGSVTSQRVILGLWLLDHYRTGSDYRTVVTTNASASNLIEEYVTSDANSEDYRLGIVDTTSKRESLTKVYQPIPTIYTTRYGDITRTAMAISELDGILFSPGDQRHLLISSFSSILNDSSLNRSCRLINSVTSPIDSTGCTILDVDLTEHEAETINELRAQTDGVIWVEEQKDGAITAEYSRQ